MCASSVRVVHSGPKAQYIHTLILNGVLRNQKCKPIANNASFMADWPLDDQHDDDDDCNDDDDDNNNNSDSDNR